MATPTRTTPTLPHHQRRPSSQTRRPPSRPTTPLRAISRNSLRASTSTGPYPPSSLPLESLESSFAELSDSMADLEANFMYLGLMHESLARFSESFAAFLYGMNMNAFCVDFPEAPIPESFSRPLTQPTNLSSLPNAPSHGAADADTEATFLTTDTSFVEHPPSSRQPQKFQTPTPARGRVARGIPAPRAGRGGGRGGGGSGIARGASTGASRGARGGSGIGRGRGAAR